MKLAVLREPGPVERRVALTPPDLPGLTEVGFRVAVECGAGQSAGFPDSAYREAGAELFDDPRGTLAGAGALVRIHPPRSGEGADEATWLPEGCVVVTLVGPDPPVELLDALTERRGTLLALERLPRITRAQSMDVLSSQATVSGYLAPLVAASHFTRFFPMLTTAAGTIPPARVLVLGAGVAGLQAIATARRLGGSVTGYDVRPAAREQIRSLGASVLEEEDLTPGAEGAGGYARDLSEDERDRQMELLSRAVPRFDVVITTAQIPGRRAPTLITAEMVEGMEPGSVIMDLAGETGGNCTLSRPGEVVVQRGVTVDAPLLLPARLPTHASRMFGRNVSNLLRHLASDGGMRMDLGDEITNAICMLEEGRPHPDPGGPNDG